MVIDHDVTFGTEKDPHDPTVPDLFFEEQQATTIRERRASAWMDAMMKMFGRTKREEEQRYRLIEE